MIGTWITAFLSVSWSGTVITPDLLMAGLFCCGISRLLSGKWVANTRTAFGAGIVLGTAYLAKRIALPVSALVVMALAVTNLAIAEQSAADGTRHYNYCRRISDGGRAVDRAAFL